MWAAQDVVERAGNASFRSRDPSNPLSPLQLDADTDWNADMGATSHMMPHHHWLRNYSPKRVPIKLADNTVVYSAGVGSVVFHPTVEGKRGRAVEFSNVLHVPQLRNNLLAVLYLTRRSSIDVHINSTHMSFSHSNGPPLFIAPINHHNAAFLDGVTEPITEYASPATTVPLDLALWHRRLAHHNITDVKALIEQQLVTGMQLDVKTAPDPLCEPCLAGKMHANPFPSTSWHASRPLEGTMDYAISYAPDPSMSQLFTTYSDANHGGCKDTGRSTGAYIVKLGSGIVSWHSKRQSIVALSTTEAEYMAACEAGKEIVWMRKMLQELCFPMPTSSVLVHGQPVSHPGGETS